MHTTKAMLVFVLTLALAFPAAALAQSAGDEQYVDPFQNQTSGGGGGGSNGNQSDSGSQTTPQTSSSSGSSSSGTAGTDTTSGGDGSALPRTGLPLIPLFLGGALLMGGGATLRRRA
jgi:hypothetical protein